VSTTLQSLSSTQAQQLGEAIRLLQGGQPDQALAIARSVAAAAPRAPDALQLLALCNADAGHFEAADQAFRRALQFAPDHPAILANHATLLRKMGRLDEAAQAWQRVVAAAPGAAPGWRNLGLAIYDLGRPGEARSALERAVALQPADAIAWHALGNACRALGDVETAEAAFGKCVGIAPGNGAAWTNLGAVLRLRGRPLDAIDCFGSARDTGYEGPELSDALAGALLDAGRPADALRQARELTRAHPLFVGGHVTLAHLLWEYGAAIAPGEDPFAGLLAACDRMPAHRPLQLAGIGLLLDAQRSGEALQRIRALRAAEDHPALIALEADALERHGDTTLADRLFEQAHRLLGDSDTAFLNTHARHLLKVGKWDAAAQQALAATRSDPDDQQAWAWLGTAWRLLQDPREEWLLDHERLIALVDVEPPPGFDDLGHFLAALEASLAPLHQATHEPLHQSLRSGSQTPGRLFGRPQPVLAAAERALQQAIERHLATLPDDPQHPFLRRRAPHVRFCGSWSVKLWSSGRHVNHIHAEGWMSSAFYVALPPAMLTPSGAQAQAGWIQFGQPPLELGLDLPPRRVIRPRPGALALFPSYMWHGTVPFEDSAPRITIAFDMLPDRRPDAS
jgi:Flp pilus assembly protein TadD